MHHIKCITHSNKYDTTSKHKQIHTNTPTNISKDEEDDVCVCVSRISSLFMQYLCVIGVTIETNRHTHTLDDTHTHTHTHTSEHTKNKDQDGFTPTHTHTPNRL
eukprot:GHVR01171444.1.p1 GENE.GHVR01171444.1~~GHVR01171444.1.p1  ORF type:complete len:104 (+),score=79.56 GHVR01171444.1:206-517(+)